MALPEKYIGSAFGKGRARAIDIIDDDELHGLRIEPSHHRIDDSNEM